MKYTQDVVQTIAQQLIEPLQAIKLDAEYRENSFVAGAAVRSLDIIEAALLYGRVDSRQLELQLLPVHVGDIVVRVVNALRNQLLAQGVECDIDIQRGLPAVEADPVVLEMALKMLWQAVLQRNAHNSVVRVALRRSRSGDVRLSLTARGLLTDNIVFEHDEKPSLSTPLDTSRALFSLIRADLSKQSKTDLRGFGVSLVPSKQLVLL